MASCPPLSPRRVRPRHGCAPGRLRPGGFRAPCRRASGLTRERFRRTRAPALLCERPKRGVRSRPRGPMRAPSRVADGSTAGFRRGGLLARWLQLDAGTSGLGQADRDRLLGGTSPVYSFANVFDLFPNELSRLRARRFPLSLVALGALDCLFLGHDLLLSNSLDCYWRYP